MTRSWIAALFWVTTTLIAPTAPLRAGELSDLLLKPGLLAEAKPGEVLRYRVTRHLLPEAAPAEGKSVSAPGRARDAEAQTNPDGADLVLIAESSGGQRIFLLTYDRAGEQRLVAQFPLAGANPVLLYFLETVVRDVAAQTGGSPFYVKNRLIEALARADFTPGQGETVVTLTPFADDPNTARLKDFASLSLALTFDPAKPGRLLRLKADTAQGAAGYSEALDLIKGAD